MDVRTRERRPRTTRPAAGPLVVTADTALLEHVLAAAAAAGVEASVTDEPSSVRGSWSSAPMVVVGADRARALADLVLPHRAEVVLVGQPAQQGELERWSGPLGAAVAVLPESVGWLTAALADVSGRGGRSGRIVAVVGGVGGVGASSLAAALAVAGAMSGPAMVADLDPLGGGIDLVMGVEGQPGWRWPRLTSAQGHVGDIRDQLPQASGVSVLATGRGPEALEPVGVQSVKAVLTAAARHHGLVVVDLPREPTPPAREALRLADTILLCTSADVRGVAGARQVLHRLSELEGRRPLAVIRRCRGGIDPSLTADSLELDLAAVVNDDPTAAKAAESGEPPGRLARSTLGRAAREIADRVSLDQPRVDRRGPAREGTARVVPDARRSA